MKMVGKPTIRTPRNLGFTIVELLIVIVVIAILAVISIVAYNGIQSRAQAAAVASALEQVSKKLALYSIDNSTYPVDLATAGITNSSSTSYQYSVNNSVTPRTYCVTGTNGTTSYQISSTATTPTSGGCAGHGVGGVGAVTNLVTNPSFETDLNGWTPYFSPTRTKVSENYQFGGYSQKIVTASSTQAQGAYFVVTKAFTASSTIRASVWVKCPANLSLSFGFRSPTQMGAGYGASSFTTTGNWQRVEISYIMPTTPDSWYAPQIITNAPFPDIGTAYYIDGIMFSEGNLPTAYYDGNSPNWVWNGTPNGSTSTGPAL